jgi:hypothetical protein
MMDPLYPLNGLEQKEVVIFAEKGKPVVMRTILYRVQIVEQ